MAVAQIRGHFQGGAPIAIAEENRATDGQRIRLHVLLRRLLLGAGRRLDFVALMYVEARGDDRHADVLGQAIVDYGAEDDLGIRAGFLVDQRHDLVDLVEREIGVAGDIDQYSLGTGDRHVLQKRTVDRLASGLHGPLFAAVLPESHNRIPALGNYRAHVVEVEIDHARNRNQVGNTTRGLHQHLVGLEKRILERGVAAANFQQALVFDGDQGVNLVL